MYNEKQLNRMQAHVVITDESPIVLRTMNGEIVELSEYTMFVSYYSRCAVYSNDTLYLLPRYDYSVTTIKQLHEFMRQYCGFDTSIHALRAIEKSEKHETDTVVHCTGIGYGKYYRDSQFSAY